MKLLLSSILILTIKISTILCDQIDYNSYSAFLKKYVSEQGFVSYTLMKQDSMLLDNFLDALSTHDLSGHSKEERLAFWINAYNACTLKLILRNIPDILRITDLPEPWKQKEWTVAGQTLSLDDIEHQILRQEFNEPRIHFAIVCASHSCPDLLPTAYLPSQIEEQLETQTARFLQSSKGLQIQIRKENENEIIEFSLSKIFVWFKEDFEEGQQTVLDFIYPYISESEKKWIDEARNRIQISSLPYDWNLNGK